MSSATEVNIKNRTIYLCGESEEIHLFLQAYQDRLQICSVLTDHKEEVALQEYADYGVNTVLLDEIQFEDELIVICDSIHFVKWVRRLQHLRREEYQHYVSQILVDAVLNHKKLMLCMGTRLIMQVGLLFQKTPDIMEHCSVVCFDEDAIEKPYRNRMQEYIHVCRVCDVYVRSSCEMSSFGLKVRGRKTLKPDCREITVSDYGFAGYFPQYEKDRLLKSNLLLREYERLEMSYNTFAISRTEIEMEGRCIGGQDEEAIYAEVMREDFYSSRHVNDYFREELNRIRGLEENDTIRLADFIEAHSTECLCRNLDEWREPVISYVAKSILKLIGAPELSMTTEEREALLEEDAGSDFLIYPSVRKALNLQEQKNGLYRVVTYYRTRYMSEEEYARFLITYYCKAYDLLTFTGTDDRIQCYLDGKQQEEYQVIRDTIQVLYKYSPCLIRERNKDLVEAGYLREDDIEKLLKALHDKFGIVICAGEVDIDSFRTVNRILEWVKEVLRQGGEKCNG